MDENQDTNDLIAKAIRERDIETLKSQIHSATKTRSDAGLSPIHLACECNFIEGVNYLLSTGLFTLESSSDTDKSTNYSLTNKNGRNLLHVATEKGNLNMIKLLISKGFDPYQETETDKLTCLHIACKEGHVNVVAYYVNEIKMDPRIKGGFSKKLSEYEEREPIHYAALHGRLEVLRFLVEQCHCDPNVQDHFGKTPAFLAGECRNVKIMEYLVEENNCDPTSPSKATHSVGAGRQAIHLASFVGDKMMIEYLVSKCHVPPHVQDERGVTPLICAAQEGKINVVKLLCSYKEGFSPNMQDKTGRTPLHYACLTGELEVVIYLTESVEGVDVNILENFGETPVMIAAKNGHRKVVEYLVMTRGCSVDTTVSGTKRLIDYASYKDWQDIVIYLVTNRHCNPEQLNDIGLSPLHYAAENNALSVLRYFLEDLKCDPNLMSMESDTDSTTPLLRACMFGCFDVVKYLITDRKCSISKVSEKMHMTPLHMACSGGHEEIVRFLIELCQHPTEVPNSQGVLPLHLAILNNHSNVVKYLIEEQKCDPMKKTNGGATGIHAACQGGHIYLLMYLLENPKFCQNWRVIPGNSPLDLAAEGGHIEVVKYLVYNMICDPRKGGNNGMTSLHWAALKGHNKVVEFLVENEFCGVLIADVNGRIPLHLACDNGHVHVIKYLLTKDKKQLLYKDVKNHTPLQLAKKSNILSTDVLSCFVVAGASSQELIEVAPDKCHFMTSSQLLYSYVRVFLLGNCQCLVKQLNLLYEDNQEFHHHQIPVGVNYRYHKMIGNIIYYQVSPTVVSIKGVLSDAISLCEHPVFIIGLDCTEGFSDADINYWLQFVSHLTRHYSKLKSVTPLLLFSLTVNASTTLEDIDSISAYLSSYPIPQSLIIPVHVLKCDIDHDYPYEGLKFLHFLSSCINSLQQSTCLSAFSTALKLFSNEVFHDGTLSHSLSDISNQILRKDAPLSSDINELAEAFSTLCQSGYLIFIRNEDDLSQSCILSEVDLVLAMINMCMADMSVKSPLAITSIDEIYTNSECPFVQTVLLDLLQYMSICTNISVDEENDQAEPSLFMPCLLSHSQPSGITINTDHSSEISLGWLLQCKPPSVFSVDLCIQLPLSSAVFSSACTYTNCSVWNGGIQYTDGTLQVVVTHLQKQAIIVLVKDLKRHALKVTKTRSRIIEQILSLKKSLCDEIPTEEHLLHPYCLTSLNFDGFPPLSAIPLMELLQMSKHTEHIFNCTPMELFGLDPFFILDANISRKLFNDEQSQCVISNSDINAIVISFSPHCEAFAEMLGKELPTELDSDINRALSVLTEWITATDTKRKSYKDLWNSLKKYSIFSIRSPCI